MIKRLFDVVVAGAALTVMSPVLAALAAAIVIDSGRPVLFRQVRVGKDGRPISIAKLRTMRAAPGALVTAEHDPRVTRVGGLLRRTKLDELPQLWNILRGDMSIVGPRPEVPRYVELYRGEQRRLLEVRPGLTDSASIAFRDEEQILGLAHDRERAYIEVVMPMKLELALGDVAQSSLANDLRIIVSTVSAVVRGGRDDVAREARRRIEQLNQMGDV